MVIDCLNTSDRLRSYNTKIYDDILHAGISQLVRVINIIIIIIIIMVNIICNLFRFYTHIYIN